MLTKTYNILIVEDEWINANFIAQILEKLQQKVIAIVSNAKEALKYLEKYDVDFIFMDINIDGPEDGITLSHKINLKKTIPIIYMTAFCDSNTIKEASYTNIYGFIIKPFMEKDVEATFSVAVQRVMRENKNRYIQTSKETSLITLGEGYTFDLQESVLYLNNNYIVLSVNESKLLKFLLAKHNMVISIESIRETVWKDKDIGESNIRDTILRLRKKISPLKIENVAGIGYKLNKEFQ
jgi:DNA-binding response OmpR family regulator